YWACLALAALIAAIWNTAALLTFPGFPTPDQLSAGNWANQITIFSITPSSPLPSNFKLISQSWSLENELYFYVVLGLCTYRSKQLTIAAFCLALFYDVFLLNYQPGLFYLTPAGNAFIFFMGAVAYFLGQPARPFGLALLSAGAALLLFAMFG